MLIGYLGNCSTHFSQETDLVDISNPQILNTKISTYWQSHLYILCKILDRDPNKRLKCKSHQAGN